METYSSKELFWMIIVILVIVAAFFFEVLYFTTQNIKTESIKQYCNDSLIAKTDCSNLGKDVWICNLKGVN